MYAKKSAKVQIGIEIGQSGQLIALIGKCGLASLLPAG
jgi:hypothetical protein